jgi:hypothetical protein
MTLDDNNALSRPESQTAEDNRTSLADAPIMRAL